MEHKYKGWIIERIEGNGPFHMRIETESNWHDAADTLKEAKKMINCFTLTGLMFE